jgi:hypothetical protein
MHPVTSSEFLHQIGSFFHCELYFLACLERHHAISYPSCCTGFPCLTLDVEAAEYNCACICVTFYLHQTRLDFWWHVMTFPLTENFTLSYPQTSWLKSHVKICLNIVPIFFLYAYDGLFYFVISVYDCTLEWNSQPTFQITAVVTIFHISCVVYF